MYYKVLEPFLCVCPCGLWPSEEMRLPVDAPLSSRNTDKHTEALIRLGDRKEGLIFCLKQVPVGQFFKWTKQPSLRLWPYSPSLASFQEVWITALLSVPLCSAAFVHEDVFLLISGLQRGRVGVAFRFSCECSRLEAIVW